MELFKRILAALLCAAVTLPLIACGSGESTQTTPVETESTAADTEPAYVLPEADWAYLLVLPLLIPMLWGRSQEKRLKKEADGHV